MSGTSGHGRTHGIPALGQESAPGLRSTRSGSGASVEVFAPRGASETVTSERDLSDLVSRFKSLSTSGSDKLVRPGFGSHGIQTRLRTNFFRLNLTQSVSLFDYILKVEPPIDVDDEDLRKHVIKLFDGSKEMAPFTQGVAHDGVRRLIARAPLPQNIHVTVNVPAGDKAYRVTLVGPRELRTTDLSRFLRGDDPEYNPVPIVSAFNLIVSDFAARNGICGSGKRAFYFEPNTETGVRVRADMTVINGFFMSVRPVYNSLMVNVNACMSAFYVPKERLSDAMLSYRRESHGAMHPAKFFGKIRVTTNYLGYPRRSNVKGFGEPARKATFRSEEMGKVTVEKYFQKKYGITLQHADDLPVVILGNSDKDALVPAELCTIEAGSLFTGQLTRRESAALCAANSKSPKGDAQTLAAKGSHLLGFDRKVQPMASFGINVSPELAVVSARILPSPTIVCKSGQLQVSNGSWTTRGFRFAKPAGLSKMAVLILQDGGEDYTSNSEGALHEAVQALLAKCRSCGMEVDPSYIVRIIQLPEASSDDPYRDQAVRMIQSTVANFPGRPNIVLTLMSNRDTHIFAGVRRVLDTVVGCQGLVALTSNIQDKDGQDQYLTNLALKLNAKMGGINHLLDPASLKWLQGTMLVGLDLTPPGEGSMKGAPSVAAMTASVNGSFAQYPASLSLQDGKKLAIVNAKNMLIERLKDYRRQNKALPDRIIVFRAGLSDGAIQKVAMADVAEIKKAFRDLADYKPRLTYVVCNKGHKVKFYPMRPEDADPTSNPKAGTVVDQGITSIYEYDFYLQAHSASQGTAKATHYVVVYDENKFSPDTLQHGINDLCYLWAPASTSVSLAPPAYWADRACARARLYLHRIMSPIAGSKETKMSERELESRVKGLWGGGVHDDLKGSMYYM